MMFLKNGLFYSCGCSPEANGGLYLCREAEDGHMENVAFYPLTGTNYLCFHGTENLYATWNDGLKAGGVAAYVLNPEDGTIRYLNRAESNGTATCHLTASPDGKFLYAVNYLTGNFAEFKLDDNGAIAEQTQVISHAAYPVGPRTARQECAHTHCSRFTPDGNFLCIVDLGVDRIFLYPYEKETGIRNEPNIFTADPGDGPRHIIFDERHPATAYIINELGNSITSCKYENGTLTAIRKTTTLPENCTATTKASAIRISPDGKFLYASNRGYDSIACYKITDPENGLLELFDITDAHGESPRDINFLPSGKFFTASNEFSDKICTYAVDTETGRLTWLPELDVTNQPRPLCIEY